MKVDKFNTSQDELKQELLKALKNPKYRAVKLKSSKEEAFIDLLKQFKFTDKNFIQEGFPFSWIDDSEQFEKQLKAGQLEIGQTSGTTGDRTQLFREKNWWVCEYEKTSRAHNILRKIYLKPVKKCVLTTARCSGTDCHVGKVPMEARKKGDSLFLNSSKDPSSWQEEDFRRIIDEVNLIKPDFIAADPFYLMHLVI